jgi:hypothetical protein
VLKLWVRTGTQLLREIPFVVDTGAAVTTLSASEATKLGIPVPRKAFEFTLETATGPARQIRYPGRLRGRILGLAQWDFDWACHFVVHQGPPPQAALGLADVINDVRITFDGRYMLEAPYGWLILEHIRT